MHKNIAFLRLYKCKPNFIIAKPHFLWYNKLATQSNIFLLIGEQILVKDVSFFPHTLLTELRLCGNNKGEHFFGAFLYWGALFNLYKI